MIIWIRKNKFEFLLLVLILLLGIFLRFYQIHGHATFLGDEGRDALIVKGMIVDHKFTLLGPTASFGNLYLGPAYYYMMLLPLWLANFDPVGPAMMVATFGVLAIILLWKMARDFFGPVAAFSAASLYAVSHVVITHTRSSWNPNPMPFFSLLAIYSLYRTIKDQNGKWLVPLGASLGIALQLHYIAFVLMGIVLLIFFFLRVRLSWKWYLAGLASFTLFLSPQILFELRHNFVNSRAMVDFFLRRGEFTASAGVGFDKLAPFSLYFRLFRKLITIDVNSLAIFLGAVSGLTGFYFAWKQKAWRTKNLGLTILLLWLFLGIFFIPFYRGTLHDHYLGFLFPTPFLLAGFFFSRLWVNRFGKVIVIVGLVFFLGLNLSKTNIFSGAGPNWQIQRTRQVSQTIAQDVGKKSFNLALVSPTGDFMALNYRYFLELFGKNPEDYGNFDKIDILYVIEEAKWVSPEELGLWEVGTFGPFTNTRDWTFDFQVVVYRLEHKK